MHAVLFVPQLSSSRKKCLPVVEKSCTDAQAAVRIWEMHFLYVKYKA